MFQAVLLELRSKVGQMFRLVNNEGAVAHPFPFAHVTERPRCRMVGAVRCCANNRVGHGHSLGSGGEVFAKFGQSESESQCEQAAYTCLTPRCMYATITGLPSFGH